MNNTLKRRIAEVYNNCSFLISEMTIHSEGRKYNACEFNLNGKKVISRNAKTTPKKNGQFVIFWKRNNGGFTEPFHQSDCIDFYAINVIKDQRIGQFIIPQSALLANKIISTEECEGKRGFRVYPNWDTPNSKQANKTQLWQSKYFIEFSNKIDLNVLKELYKGV